MTKVKYIKACPFLRDLGDSYLCVNDDKVVDVLIDPLVNIEWSEELPPTASEAEGCETCLFVLEIKEDNRLFCSSRQMYLKMDKHYILWEDIRDSVFLLNLNTTTEFRDTEIDFCSTCLYKVLIASSPAFQARLSKEEKIKLGYSYILNKANEIYTGLLLLAEALSNDNLKTINEKCTFEKSKASIFNQQISTLSWLSWVTESEEIDEVFASTTFEWLQKLDEWVLLISKIPETEDDLEKINLIKESFNYAARIKEISFEIILKLTYLKKYEDEAINLHIKNIEKMISVSGVQFEDYMFICNQFFIIMKELGIKIN
ncbi:MAG: hypothetical protein JXA54_03025 [Candidatus Heimdallarchaeota archaeon]|nr:hypothetical protein [Candidatus Heimdallarchaeota archaeon]